MKRYWNHYITIIILLAVILSMASLPAAAVAPTYELGEEYQSSPYYTRLLDCELTGDGRFDVLAVALTQLGYHEGDSDAEMDGADAKGSRNFVEYNRMYGKLDNGEGNGMSYGYSWCAAFVSWCLRHAGIPEEIAVTEVSCRRMTDWYRENFTYHPRESGYLPKPGDIIMFHDGDGVAHHVGLVLGMERGRVHVIDGNGKEEAVATHVYHRNSRAILGYCVPDYPTEPGTVYDFLPERAPSDGAMLTLSIVIGVTVVAVAALLATVAVRIRGEKLRQVAQATETEDEKGE